MDTSKLLQIASNLNKPQQEKVSKGMTIFLEFWGIVILLVTFTAISSWYAKVPLFLLGSLMYVRGRQLDAS
jgi:hypothetical protein